MKCNKLQFKSADTHSSELIKILKQDGCLVLEDFISEGAVDALRRDLDPYINATSRSSNDFGGFKTTRTGALMARSPK